MNQTIFQVFVDGQLCTEVTVTERRDEINPTLWKIIWEKLEEHTAKGIQLKTLEKKN